MSQGRGGPFLFVAIVIVACLAAGVWMSMSERDAPSLVISVVLACAVAALLYCILGSVGEAGFKLGPLKMGGSAAVLVGSAYLFDMLLEPQLVALREARLDTAVAEMRFDFNRHATPAEGWFAISRETAGPISVSFTDPVRNEVVKTVRPPAQAGLRLTLAKRDANDNHLVSGTEGATALGYISRRTLMAVLGSLGDLEPNTIYGPKRLHLVREGELPLDKPRIWGFEQCLGSGLPMRLRVDRFYDSFAIYEVLPCGSSQSIRSSLAPGQAELHRLTIQGRHRAFVIAVVAANHHTSPFWSSFLVIEMVKRQL